MANTLVLLERITVGAAGAASVTFNSIPQTGYTDLLVYQSARSDSSAPYRYQNMTFNGSGTGYSWKDLYGDSGTVGSQTASTTYAGYTPAATATASTFSNTEFYIPNYTSSNYKSWTDDSVTENNASASGSVITEIGGGVWANTAAITSITLTAYGSSNYIQYSTFSLYGVSAVGTTPTKAPKALGGNIIETDGTYWYHAFLSSGTFTPATALSCDVLVVAGGGGNGGGVAGGSGAGGVLAFASQALLTNTGYTVTIGAGGSTSGTNGGNSQFASLTAAVGGGGASGTTSNSGGSGAGQTGQNAGSAAAGTSGQGYAGGANDYPVGYGGGGGGAGAVGGVGGANSRGGDGGIGTNSVTNWGALSAALTATGLGASGYLAGGGGGAAWGGVTPNNTGGNGGTGGGGTGGNNTGFTNGTANTGGGGGGNNGSGTSGGSGLIVVRYAA